MRKSCITKVNDDPYKSSSCNALLALENSHSAAQPLQMTARAEEAVASLGYRGERHRNKSAAASNLLTSLHQGEASHALPNGPRATSRRSLGGVHISNEMDRAVIKSRYPPTRMALVKLVKPRDWLSADSHRQRTEVLTWVPIVYSSTATRQSLAKSSGSQPGRLTNSKVWRRNWRTADPACLDSSDRCDLDLTGRV